MKKILFPTDFSAAADNAFVHALHLAKRLHAEIVTLHVTLPPTGVYDEQLFYSETYEILELGAFEGYRTAVMHLGALAEKEQCQHVRTSHILQQGEVIDRILDTAETEKPDFIVMGTTGASGLKEAFLGTNTEKVLNRSRSIVWAIPEDCVYKTPKNILFLTEFDKMQPATLQSVRDLAAHFEAHVDVLHIKRHHDEDEQQQLEQFKKQYPGPDIHFNVLVSTDVEGTIQDFVEVSHIDVMALEVREKGFFEKLIRESLSRKLAFHSNIPLMAIHGELFD